MQAARVEGRSALVAWWRQQASPAAPLPSDRTYTHMGDSVESERTNMPLCEHENDGFKHCTYAGRGCVASSHPQGSDGSFAFFALFIQLVVAPFPLAVLRFMQPTAGAGHSTYLKKHTLAAELHMGINDIGGIFSSWQPYPSRPLWYWWRPLK